MLKPTLSGDEAVAVLLVVSAACTPRDSTYIVPGVSGGPGGTQGSGGAGNVEQPDASRGIAGAGCAGGLFWMLAAMRGCGLVPNIESRVPSGPLGVRVRYYRDSCRSEAITINVAVE